MSADKTTATEVAKWFIKKCYDQPRNTFDGNMKLQKLLYFSQLIHLAKNGDPLFEDPIFAFKNGSVVEVVRKKYRDEHREFINEANESEPCFDEKQLETLKTTTELFGEVSACELSELNHLHQSWKEAYEGSLIEGFHYKENSQITLDSIIKYDLKPVREMLMAHQVSKATEDQFEVVNGTTFYYNPNEIQITEEIVKELEFFKGDESAYVICKDPSKGLVIF